MAYVKAMELPKMHLNVAVVASAITSSNKSSCFHLVIDKYGLNSSISLLGPLAITRINNYCFSIVIHTLVTVVVVSLVPWPLQE
jgi:hypothetical protein